MSPVISWIKEYASGLSFCDIGGIGLNALNERATPAHEGGASEIAVIDYRHTDFPEWQALRQKLAENGVNDVQEIGGINLEDRAFPQEVGAWDFVHCTGILYHAPNPLLMLENLCRISSRYLIVNTVIIPETIENKAGTLKAEGSNILFLPGISEGERAVLEQYYQDNLGWPEGRFSGFAPRPDDEDAAMPWLQFHAASKDHYWGEVGALSYSPYWMLFTRQAFIAAVKMMGFEPIKEHSFKGHTCTLLCERTDRALQLAEPRLNPGWNADGG